MRKAMLGTQGEASYVNGNSSSAQNSATNVVPMETMADEAPEGEDEGDEDATMADAEQKVC